MFHELNLCFKCTDRDDEAVDGSILEMQVRSDEADEEHLGISITNNMTDMIDVIVDKTSLTMIYLMAQYALKFHYEMEQLPNIEFTQGDIINCYDNMKRLLDSTNAKDCGATLG